MTPTDAIKELRALYEAATPGEWETRPIHNTNKAGYIGLPGKVHSFIQAAGGDAVSSDDLAQHDANMRFTEAAHNHLPALLDELDKREKALEVAVRALRCPGVMWAFDATLLVKRCTCCAAKEGEPHLPECHLSDAIDQIAKILKPE